MDTTQVDPKVFDRIRKLLALSRSSNENEAASAAARAAALMAEHQIEDAQLRLDEGEAARPAESIVPDATLDSSSRTVVHWKGKLAGGLARSLGCRMWWQGGSIQLFGRQSAIRACTYMYQYLVGEVSRLADEAWDRRGARWDGESARAWKNAFRLGASATIARRLDDQLYAQQAQRQRTVDTAPAPTATTGALVLVQREEREVKAAYEKFSEGFTKVRGGTTSSSSGYAAGRAAGATVALGGGARLGAAQGKLAGR